MKNTMNTYENQLILALRMRSVPGDKIGHIVAEVQAHVAQSGEDPEAAFGAPAEYAKQFSRGARGAFNRGSFLGLPLILGGSFAFAQSVFALVMADEVLGLPSFAVLVLAVALVVVGVYFQVGTLDPRKADPVIDPRNGQDMVLLTPGANFMIMATVVLPFLAVLLITLVLG